MASTVFPVAASSSAFTTTLVTATTSYVGVTSDLALAAGVYTVSTNPVTSQATIQFFNGTTLLTQASTTSGTVVVTLSTATTKIYFYTTSGVSNTVLSFALTGVANSYAGPSGTVDTITATGNYATTGLLYIIAVGGGGGGGGTATYAGPFAGNTGEVGRMVEGWYTSNTTTAVTIGAAGNFVGNGGEGPKGNAGGASIFGSVLNSGQASGGTNSCCSSNNGGNGVSYTSNLTTAIASTGSRTPYFKTLLTGNTPTQAIQTGKAEGGAAGSGNGNPGVIYVVRSIT